MEDVHVQMLTAHESLDEARRRIAEDAKCFWDWATVGTPIYAHA
jgi:hypothetical protein